MIKTSQSNYIEMLAWLKAAHEILNEVKYLGDLPHKNEIVAAKKAVFKAMDLHWDFINQYISEDNT